MNKNADYAIALKVKKIKKGIEFDEGCSKFFGDPTVPEKLLNCYPDDGVFFAQIKCEDIKDLDPDNRLPHEGYLYFFLDAEMYPDDNLYMMVEHSLEQPKYILDNYNEESPIKGLDDAYVITFEKVDSNYTGTKLLGMPSGYTDENDDYPGLLLQYDPLDFDVEFQSSLDGYIYVFFGKDEKRKFSGVEYVVERS